VIGVRFWLWSLLASLVVAGGCVGFIAAMAGAASAQEVTTTTTAAEPTTTTTAAPGDWSHEPAQGNAPGAVDRLDDVDVQTVAALLGLFVGNSVGATIFARTWAAS
jgi:hypothetical protein